MQHDVVTIGDAFEDVFVQPDLKVNSDRSFGSGKGICFEFGEKIPLNFVQYEIGGSACNIAVGLSRLGYKTTFVTALGKDTPAQRIIRQLEDEGVDTKNVIEKSDIQTGFSVVFSVDGERTIFSYHALKDYSKLKIKDSLKSKWLFVTSLGENIGEIEKRIIAEVSEEGSLFAWNPGSIQIARGASHYRHLLRCTSILFLNREEAIKFLDYPARPIIEEVMKKLHNFGARIVVVTNGKEGARAYDGQEFYEMSAIQRTERIDATGAGDAFATGFLGRLIDEDWKKDIDSDIIKNALKWGIANSNSVIQHIGAQKGLLAEID
ncbi:MAG: carbohydrate kinase family protein [Patescibacteria group bacterium]